MNDKVANLTYPRLRWLNVGGWLTAIGTLFAIALFIFPEILSLSGGRRLVACAVLIAFPGALVTLAHVSRIGCLFIRRAVAYDSLVDAVSSLEERLRAAGVSLNALLQERANRNAFEIEHCYSFEQRTFVALRKKKGPSVPIGANVTVIERDTGVLMGQFRLTKESEGSYVCELTGYMDALWLGNVKQHGSQKSQPPPEAIAWVLRGTTGETDDRQ